MHWHFDWQGCGLWHDCFIAYSDLNELDSFILTFHLNEFFLELVTSWYDTQILTGHGQELVLVLTELQCMIFVYHNIQSLKWMKWSFLYLSLGGFTAPQLGLNSCLDLTPTWPQLGHNFTPIWPELGHRLGLKLGCWIGLKRPIQKPHFNSAPTSTSTRKTKTSIVAVKVG
jgi:hypothetical protein